MGKRKEMETYMTKQENDDKDVALLYLHSDCCLSCLIAAIDKDGAYILVCDKCKKFSSYINLIHKIS